MEGWKERDFGKSEAEKTKFFFRKCSLGENYSCPQVPSATREPFVEDNDCDENLTGDISGPTFIFVHQEPWQQKLMLKYGNTLSLLDATYKTTKYAFPLFLLCVRSNSGYIPVAY